ncbi:zinc finger protein 16-like [Phlebotomus papatasi]|uniref:zinc finger protein 16-like n=1 Tax=Phlebotomus papatasi TaxID=29031 RepID=UPI002484021A|nr:zinc finger protein 16-like [Phlebotomus papatasi]XP_055713859.1 zinc finger protein 16-like [Phlebotomus papatasi]
MEEWTVCRLCLQSTEGSMKSLPDVTYNMIPFFNIYFELVGITFTDYPTFPGKICSSCEEQMHQAYKFREKCLETEDKLKELLNEGRDNFSIEFITTPKIVVDSLGKKPNIESEVKSTSDAEISKIKDEPEDEVDVDDADIVNFGGGNYLIHKKKPDQSSTTAASNTKKQLSQKKTEELKNRRIQCKKCERIYQGIEMFTRHRCVPINNVKDQQMITKGPDPDGKKTRTRSKPSKKIYKCEQCNKTFATTNNHMLHMDKHNNFLRYACDQCDKRFSTWINRRNHIYKVHLQKKFCECSECGMGFYKLWDLKKHITTEHLKLRPYQCEACGKTFKHPYTLKSHVETHNTSKTVSCEICGRQLKSRKTLIQHMSIHSEEKNYVCPVCSKAFTWNVTMKSHVRSAHPNDLHLLPPDGTIVNKRYLKKKAEMDG